MPELPEVEIIRKGLASQIIGKEIAGIDVNLKKSLQGPSESLIGRKIISIDRRAKMLIFNLSDGISLLVHLKLTGQLVFDKKAGDKDGRVAGGHPSADWVGDLPSKFTHVVFNFSDGSVLYFNDLRQFGYIKIYQTEELKSLKVLNDLGYEPFDKEATPEYLMKIISRRPKAKIKQLILDQSVLAGVGNIYADEGLFCAGISPLRTAKELSRTELEQLISCIRKVMDKSFEFGGSSENTFVNAFGEKGEMQNHFNIYRKAGKICPCGGKVKRTVVGGRGTYYCPSCQK